jgi:hypothetical protein
MYWYMIPLFELYSRDTVRHIVSTIEDIIVVEDPDIWEQWIRERVYRLTAAEVPAVNGGKTLLEGNLWASCVACLTLIQLDPSHQQVPLHHHRRVALGSPAQGFLTILLGKALWSLYEVGDVTGTLLSTFHYPAKGQLQETRVGPSWSEKKNCYVQERRVTCFWIGCK